MENEHPVAFHVAMEFKQKDAHFYGPSSDIYFIERSILQGQEKLRQKHNSSRLDFQAEFFRVDDLVHGRWLPGDYQNRPS
jgi:hypothetical protein